MVSFETRSIQEQVEAHELRKGAGEAAEGFSACKRSLVFVEHVKPSKGFSILLAVYQFRTRLTPEGS